MLVDMTNDILLHVRGYRQLTIGRVDRIATSLPEHLAITRRWKSVTLNWRRSAPAITPSGLPPMSKRMARNSSSALF